MSKPIDFFYANRPTTTVHVLFEGLPICRFTSELPDKWPAGHRWISIDARAPLRNHGNVGENPVMCTACAAERDVLLAFGVAIVTSLLVNDSAAYELAGAIAVVGAFAHFAPAPAPARARSPVLARLRARFEPEPVPVPGESPPG